MTSYVLELWGKKKKEPAKPWQFLFKPHMEKLHMHLAQTTVKKMTVK